MGAAALREGQRWWNNGASPSFFAKPFQNSACFLQASPKKAFAVLWDFNGLHGSKKKSPNKRDVTLESPFLGSVLSLKFRHQIGVRSEFPIARPANPRDIPDNMTLDSFEIVEDGIATVQINRQAPAAVWLRCGESGRSRRRGRGYLPQYSVPANLLNCYIQIRVRNS
jgi:hypothetical protein